MAPSKLPKPPITTTINVGIKMVMPMVVVAEKIGAAATPASPAKAQPKQNTKKNQRPTLIPNDAAISAFSTLALIMAPICVRLRTTHMEIMTTKPRAMIKSR